ncbi:hypothetical protein ACFQH3_02440 [Haladaptatus sp. GCM10025707]|uniref:hypothetical protein n=1 Tax=unclassified Haladaptatus TaxID=2622732 RepID=UPI0023E795C5|nr:MULTISPECIES: hypothetical protein [unclassified Haladaptatus]
MEVFVPSKDPNNELNQISVSKQDVENALPQKINGIAGRNGTAPVTVEDIPVYVRETSCTYQTYYDTDYRPIPDGCAYRTESGARCTIATPATNISNGEGVLISAAHCFVIPQNTLVYQSDVDNNHEGFLGRYTFEESPYFDAAVIETDGVGTKYDLADDGGTYRDMGIAGTLSRQYIEDMEGTQGKLTFQGSTTGTSLGNVTSVSGDQYATNNPTEKGDSGGPSHRPQTGSYSTWTTIGGVLSRKDDNNPDWRWFTFMEEIENELNVTI